MILPVLRLSVQGALCVLACSLLACSGGSGGTSPPTGTSTPPSTAAQHQAPPPSTPAPFTGTYAGTWVSTTTPSAGGAVEIVLADGVTATQHWVRFTGAPCSLIGSLNFRVTETHWEGGIFVNGGGGMALSGTLSADGRSLTATYSLGGGSLCRIGDGVVTLVQGPVVRSLSGTPILLTAATMAALTGEVYGLTPGSVFVPGLTTAVTTLFPTAQTFQQFTDCTEGLGTLQYVAPAAMTFQYTGGTLLPAGTMRRFQDAALGVAVSAIEIGGPVAVAQSRLSLLVAMGLRAESQVVTARLKVLQNGALVLINRGTGQEVDTRINVMVPGFLGIGEGR